MASPPKPWETNILPTSNNNINFTSSLPSPPESTLTTPSASTNSLSGIPEIPSRPEINPLTNTRPSALNSVYGNPTGGYGTGYGTGYGSTGYGTTGYGTAGYGTAGYGATGYGGGLYGGNSMGMYGNRMSPYGSGGLYGSSYGGGGMYGGNSMGMYGNRMNPYGNRMGPNGMPFEGGEMTFTQQMELTTQSTFQILDQVVQVSNPLNKMMIILCFFLLGFWRICTNARVDFFCYTVFVYGHDWSCRSIWSVKKLPWTSFFYLVTL